MASNSSDEVGGLNFIFHPNGIEEAQQAETDTVATDSFIAGDGNVTVTDIAGKQPPGGGDGDTDMTLVAMGDECKDAMPSTGFTSVPIELYMQASALSKKYDFLDESKRMENKLGAGSFGVVVKACHKDHGYVAVKLAKREQRNQMAMYTKEIQKLAKTLLNKHIVSIIGFIEIEPDLFGIVMDYMERGSLWQFRTEVYNDVPPWPITVEMVYKMAQGMKFLHSKGIIHRDLKLENVLVDENFNVKIADLGLSTDPSTSSGADMECGTDSHKPPEVFDTSTTSRANVTTKYDVYSYALTVYELLAGIHPYSGRKFDMLRLLKFTLKKTPELDQIDCNPPEQLKNIMKRGWSFDARDRPEFEEIADITEELCKSYSGQKSLALQEMHNKLTPVRSPGNPTSSVQGATGNNVPGVEEYGVHGGDGDQVESLWKDLGNLTVGDSAGPSQARELSSWFGDCPSEERSERLRRDPEGIISTNIVPSEESHQSQTPSTNLFPSNAPRASDPGDFHGVAAPMTQKDQSPSNLRIEKKQCSPSAATGDSSLLSPACELKSSMFASQSPSAPVYNAEQPGRLPTRTTAQITQPQSQDSGLQYTHPAQSSSHQSSTPGSNPSSSSTSPSNDAAIPPPAGFPSTMQTQPSQPQVQGLGSQVHSQPASASPYVASIHSTDDQSKPLNQPVPVVDDNGQAAVAAGSLLSAAYANQPAAPPVAESRPFSSRGHIIDLESSPTVNSWMISLTLALNVNLVKISHQRLPDILSLLGRCRHRDWWVVSGQGMASQASMLLSTSSIKLNQVHLPQNEGDNEFILVVHVETESELRSLWEKFQGDCVLRTLLMPCFVDGQLRGACKPAEPEVVIKDWTEQYKKGLAHFKKNNPGKPNPNKKPSKKKKDPPLPTTASGHPASGGNTITTAKAVINFSQAPTNLQIGDQYINHYHGNASAGHGQAGQPTWQAHGTGGRTQQNQPPQKPKLTMSTAKVTSDDILNISVEVLGVDVASLGRHLGLSNVEVSNIIYRYRMDRIDEQAYQVMLEWMQQNGSKSSKKLLAEALWNAKCYDAAQLVR